MQVGQQNMYDYVRSFGFGQRTGIELPAESPGKLRQLDAWGTTSLASVSMGQEVSVTTLQLAQAGSVIANGGLLVQAAPGAEEGRPGRAADRPPVRVIKPETAITMRQMMEGVVLSQAPASRGAAGRLYGRRQDRLGADLRFRRRKHYTHTYNGSFMGFAPVTNPAIVVVVTLNGTHGEGGFGGVGGRAGVPGGGDRSAAHAGCAEGSAGRAARQDR